MGLNRVDLRHGGADRRLESLGDVVRRLERDFSRQLHVKRQLFPPADLDEREVVDLAHIRNGEGRSVRAHPDVGIDERLHVNDDVASGQRALERCLDRVGGGMPQADRSRRRHTDHDVGEIPPGRLPHPEPPQVDRGCERDDRRSCRSLGVGGSAVHQDVDVAPHQRAAATSTRTATKSAAIESPAGCPERENSETDEHRDRPDEIARKVERVRRERGARVTAGRPARRTVARLASTAITTSTTPRTYQDACTGWCPDPNSRCSARTPISTLTSDRNPASASAARCSALPWPYWCDTSAGRPATPIAK